MEDEGTVRTRPSEGCDITVGDILLFRDWMEEARHAVTEGGPFPDEPGLRSGPVRTWIGLFRALYRRWHEGDSDRMILEAQLGALELHLASLATTLYENIGSLHDSLGREERARDARERAASCVQVFELRGRGLA